MFYNRSMLLLVGWLTNTIFLVFKIIFHNFVFTQPRIEVVNMLKIR